MNTMIFYFSSSGYSYMVARDLAFRLSARLIPVKDAINSKLMQ